MRRVYNKTALVISAPACIGFALMVLILPIRWIVAAVVAAAVHELFHASAVILCGGRLFGFHIGMKGATMTAEPMSPGRELFCTLAGPFGSFLLLLFIRWIPRIAFCGAVHCVYNFLPLYPMDGGKALLCLLEILIPQKADWFFEKIQCCCIAVIWILAIYMSVFRHLGLLPLVFAFTLWQSAKKALQTNL